MKTTPGRAANPRQSPLRRAHQTASIVGDILGLVVANDERLMERDAGEWTGKPRAEISGDFNSAYTVKSTSQTDRAPAGMPRDTTTTIEAKWLGACKPDQKPGDIVMPGGIKMNIKDMEKLKALIPKQMPK